MGTVMIRCPDTGRPVSTEIETEPSVFDRLPAVPARLHCPLCGQEHVWTAREAWLSEPLLAAQIETKN
jgi:endogenous inhibitor of DNA gyrase (YacG/DUF329 family)